MENRKIRDDLYKDISELVELGIPSDIACVSYIHYILDKHHKDIGFLYPFLGILFCDHYTLLTYKGHENTITKEEKQDYLKLAHFQNLQDVIIFYQNDTSFLNKAVNACYQFERMNVFGKINYVQGLSKQDHEYLNGICPWHQLDQKSYGDWVQTDLYCKFFHSQKRANSNWDQIKEDLVIPELMGFLKNLAKHNYPNYCSNACEMISVDYMWSKYVIEKKINLDSTDMKNRLLRLQAFEENDFQTLANEFIYNDDYMYSVIESYCAIQMKEYPFENLMKVEEVKSYLRENDSIHFTKIKEFLD